MPADEIETILQPPIINRDLIDEYCEQNNSNVFDLLSELVNIGSENFKDFLNSKGGPNANRNEPLIYASDDPDYAIFLGIIKLRDGWASTSYRNGKKDFVVSIYFVNGESEISDGYVYVLDAESFIEDSLHHFTSPKGQSPLLVIPVKPADLQTKIRVSMEREFPK